MRGDGSGARMCSAKRLISRREITGLQWPEKIISLFFLGVVVHSEQTRRARVSLLIAASGQNANRFQASWREQCAADDPPAGGFSFSRACCRVTIPGLDCLSSDCCAQRRVCRVVRQTATTVRTGLSDDRADRRHFQLLPDQGERSRLGCRSG